MLKKLQRSLTLLAVSLTGLVLIAVSITALSIAERQLRTAADAAMERSMTTAVNKLQSDRVLASSWLAQTEYSENVLIFVTDGGIPLRFSGSWAPETSREILFNTAAALSAEAGLPLNRPPVSLLEAERVYFTTPGEQQDSYLTAAALVSAHNGWQAVVILRSTNALNSEIFSLRLTFVILVLLSMLALFAACWFFAGRAIRPIAQAQRQQSEFIAAASHELRSPLAVIRASSEAIGLDTAQTDILKANIAYECDRMSHLTSDLLTLAGQDAGRLAFDRLPLDADTLLLNLYERFYPLAAKKHQQLELSVPDSPLGSIVSDEHRVTQILSVLLDNAISYTPDKGTIALAAARSDKHIRFTVSDTGDGIAPEHHARLFERFYRGDAARSSDDHFGLGLSIARELTESMGGALTLTKSSQSGTVFSLQLPLSSTKPAL